MSLDDSHMGEWKRLDGTEIEDQSPPPDLVFAHVSDLHGQLGPGHQVYYRNSHSQADLDFGESDRRIERGGGIPLLSAKLEALREAYPGSVQTVMAGDTFQGSVITTFTDSQTMVDPINRHLRPDVYVPGNWDFSLEAGAEDGFMEFAERLDATVLANNLFDAETGERLLKPSLQTDVSGVSIGIIGMTNPYVDRMAPAFSAETYQFGKHPVLLAETAEALREAGADVVVAVTEIGLPWMVQAAEDIDTIDVMFSAHTHEYTYEPIVISDTETVVVESGMAEALGRVDVRIDDGSLSFRHHLFCLVDGAEYTPDPDPTAEATIAELREPFLSPDISIEAGHGTLETPIDTVVGKTKTPLYRQSFLESPWNSLFTDALREHFDADLAIAHGFRYGTAIPPGEITLEQLYSFFPMTTAVATGEALGQQIESHMEDFLIDNFSPYVYDQENGRVRSFSSNVEVILDPTAKRGRRLVDLRLEGESIDSEETFTVATYRRSGDPPNQLGGCGFPFRSVDVDDGTTPVDVLVDFLQAHSPVSYDVTGRIRTPSDGGTVQNTPADGPYPYIQPGVDYAEGEEYCETRLIPNGHSFPPEARNRFR